jgi:DNA-3-methyladenine glycosylase I
VDKIRCAWSGTDPRMQAYHDNEWGTPLHDDATLFEFLILEGAQAGLSWSTILYKRDNYRRAFDGFDVGKIVRYTDKKIDALMQDEGIVRNRLKIKSVVRNAKAYLAVQKEFGSFDEYIWQFIGGSPRINRFVSLDDIPVDTEPSRAMSKDLKKRDFNFVGPTICYALMQATGMVNDHETRCFRYKACGG